MMVVPYVRGSIVAKNTDGSQVLGNGKIAPDVGLATGVINSLGFNVIGDNTESMVSSTARGTSPEMQPHRSIQSWARLAVWRSTMNFNLEVPPLIVFQLASVR